MKGKHDQNLPLGFHVVKLDTSAPVLLSLGEQPFGIYPAGKHRIRVGLGEGTLSIDPSEPKALYNIEVHTKPAQRGETFDDVPPPAPPPPSNQLMAIRQAVKMSMGIIREEFADTGRTVYEEMNSLIDTGDVPTQNPPNNSEPEPTHEGDDVTDSNETTVDSNE